MAHERSLSEQAREMGADPRLIESIERAERTMGRKLSYVVSNGRWPNWGLDRWLLVLTLAWSSLGYTFNVGGRITGREHDIDELKAAFAVMTQKLDTTMAAVADIRVEVARVAPRVSADTSNTPAAAERKTFGYRFPPTESLIWRDK